MTTVLLDGIAFGESPRWHGGRLWFADWLAHEIVAVTPAGRREVVFRADFPTMPMCFDFLDGEPLVVSSADGLLLRLSASGVTTHADLGGRGFNEIVVARDGGCYVNGGGFDLMAGEDYRPGAILHVTPSGETRRVAGDIAFGNGMALTLDGLPHRSCTRVRAGGEVLDRLELDHGCFACALSDDTLYLVTQEWRGLDGIGGERTGRVLAHPVEVGRAR